MKKKVAVTASPPLVVREAFSIKGSAYVVTKEITEKQFDEVMDLVAQIPIYREDGRVFQSRERSSGAIMSDDAVEKSAYIQEWLINLESAKEEIQKKLGQDFLTPFLSSATLFDVNGDTQHGLMPFSRFEFLRIFSDEPIPNVTCGTSENDLLLQQLLRAAVAVYARLQLKFPETRNQIRHLLEQKKFPNIPKWVKKLNGLDVPMRDLVETAHYLDPKFDTPVDGSPSDKIRQIFAALAVDQLEPIQSLKELFLDESNPSSTLFVEWDARTNGGKTVLMLLGIPVIVAIPPVSMDDGFDGGQKVVRQADVIATMSVVDEDISDFIDGVKSAGRTGNAVPYLVCKQSMTSLLAMLKAAAHDCTDGGVELRGMVAQSELGRSIMTGVEGKRFGDHYTAKIFKEFYDFLSGGKIANPYTDAPWGSDEKPSTIVEGTPAWYREQYAKRREVNLQLAQRLWEEYYAKNPDKRPSVTPPVVAAAPNYSELNTSPQVDPPATVKKVESPPKPKVIAAKTPKKKTFFGTIKKGLGSVGRFVSRLCCCFK